MRLVRDILKNTKMLYLPSYLTHTLQFHNLSNVDLQVTVCISLSQVIIYEYSRISNENIFLYGNLHWRNFTWDVAFHLFAFKTGFIENISQECVLIVNLKVRLSGCSKRRRWWYVQFHLWGRTNKETPPANLHIAKNMRIYTQGTRGKPRYTALFQLESCPLCKKLLPHPSFPLSRPHYLSGKDI